jgi:hypothetical protein
VRFQASSYEIYGGQGATGTGLFPSTSFLPYRYHSNSAPCSYASGCCSYQKDRRTKTGNLPKPSVLSEIGQHLIDRCCHVVLKFMLQTDLVPCVIPACKARFHFE